MPRRRVCPSGFDAVSQVLRDLGRPRRRFGKDEVVQVRSLRMRRRFGVFDGIVQDLLHPRVNHCLLLGGEPDGLGKALDGIALRPGLPLVLRLVVTRIAARMPGPPISQEFQQHRSLA